MKRKTMARVLTFLLAFCLVVQLMPAPAVAAEGDTITYTFKGIPGAATLEANNWELNYWLTDQGLALNRNVTGWFGATTAAYSKLYLTDSARDSIAYNLKVPADGKYNVTITTGTAGADYTVSVNRKAVGTIASGGTSHVIENVPFTAGLNSFQIKCGATGAALDLYNIKLDWVSELEAEAFTLDFKADAVATVYEDMSFANQGIRVNKQTVSDWNNTTYNKFIHANNSNYAVIGFSKVGNYAAFDFMASEAGTYDMIVATEDNTNHGILAEAYVNGATKDADASGGVKFGMLDNAALTSNKDRTSLIKTALGTTYNNIEGQHLVGEATVNKGYNSLHFKSVTGSQGVMNLYFRKNISLVDTANTATATSSIETKTFAAKNATATATVTAPKRGLFYVYIKAKSNDNAFGGTANIVEGAHSVTQYVDFTNGYYDNETADTVVTRPIGPIWLNANKEYTVTFTELIGENTTLELDAIELREVKQNLWMVDNANQDFGGVSIDTHGWELDSETTPGVAYVPMTVGGLYGNTYYDGFNRTATGTYVHLSNAGTVGFNFNVPVAGTYKITGNFRHYANAINPMVRIAGTNLNSEIKLNQESGDTWGEEEIGVVELKAGLNTITFNRYTGDRFLCMENLTFTPYTGATVKDVTVTADTELTVDDTATATATVNMSDGSAAPEGTTVTWSSSAAGVAKVDASTGAITAVGAGEAVITATANVMGVNYTGSVTVKVSAKAEEIPSIFGNTYAYIRETVVDGETDYTLVLVAAIDSLNYKEVGFGISDSSLGNTEAGTDKVYTEIQVNGASYTAADFGLTGGYLFVREIPVASANAEKSIDFWAYAIANDEAGTKTTGGARTIDALVKAE